MKIHGATLALQLGVIDGIIAEPVGGLTAASDAAIQKVSARRLSLL